MLPEHTTAESAEELSRSFVDEGQVVDLSDYRIEDWLAFALFWLLCAVVFLQFFTRYALNDSAAWTEEIARYLLIFIVFIGAAMCVRFNRHIQVDLLYRYLPRAAGRVLATGVDVIRILFLGYSLYLVWQVMQRVGNQPMTMIAWPMAVVHVFVMIGFGFMLLRAVILAIDHLRRGTSILEDPSLQEGRAH
jgi:TRAP-type C4-dicarboxylate transport system permease small subunit